MVFVFCFLFYGFEDKILCVVDGEVRRVDEFGFLSSSVSFSFFIYGLFFK